MMTDHEMLEELVAFKRRLQRERNLERILSAAVILVLVIALLVVGVKINARMQLLQENMDRVNQAAAELEDFFAGLKSAGYENAADALADLKEATRTVNDFFDGLRDKNVLEEGAGWVRGLFD